jgi:hypothetical protein
VIEVAATVPNFTEVAVARFVPPIVTVAPTAPLVGENPETVGAGGRTSKFVVLVAVPAGVVTEIGPVVAVEGTVVVMYPDELIEKLVTATPLNLTRVAVERFAPPIVTEAPGAPDDGLNPETVGNALVTTVKLEVLEALPVDVTTEIGPVVAPAGTGTVM